jgi:uncharacterized protein with PIN domain
VISSFLRELDEGRSRLAAIWREEPNTAAFLVHRLKAQMTLVHAKVCAGILEVLERALNERWSSEDIDRLVNNVDGSIQQVIESVRTQGLSAPKAASVVVRQAKGSVTQVT